MKYTAHASLVIVSALGAMGMGCGSGGGGGGGSAAPVATTVTAGTLVEARTDHTATALGDGQRVLITGGTSSRAPVTGTAELWEAGLSRPLPSSLSVPRAGHRAVLLPDGRVWILGGRDSSGAPLASTELYDPVQELFFPGPTLQRSRDEPAVVLVPGNGIVIAGGRGQASVESWTLDLSSSAIEPFQVLERSSGDLVLGGDPLLYLQGGVDLSGNPVGPEWLDFSTRTTRLALSDRRFVERGRAVVASVDGVTADVFVLTGRLNDIPFENLQRVRRDDTDLVQVLPRLLVPRERAAVVAVPGGILVAGGQVVNSMGQAWVIDAVEVLGPAGSSASPPLVVARRDLEGTLLADGSVLLTGGVDQNGLPVGVIDLLLPAGLSGPGSDALFARAAADRARRDQLQAQVVQLQASVAQLQSSLAFQTSESLRLQGERDAALVMLQQRTQQLQQAQAQVASLQQQLNQALQNAAAQQARIQQLQTQLAQATAAAQTAQQNLAAAQAQSGNVQQQLAMAQAQIAQLQAQAAQLQAMRDQAMRDLAAARSAQPAAGATTRGPPLKTGDPWPFTLGFGN